MVKTSKLVTMAIIIYMCVCLQDLRAAQSCSLSAAAVGFIRFTALFNINRAHDQILRIYTIGTVCLHSHACAFVFSCHVVFHVVFLTVSFLIGCQEASLLRQTRLIRKMTITLNFILCLRGN